MATTFNELPADVQAQLNKELAACKDINNAYTVELYAKGRYFYAKRFQHYWTADGQYMPYGGGSYWRLKYGRMAFRRCRNCMGTTEYEITQGGSFRKSANGTIIPAEVATKKEVLAVAKAIGIFNLN